MKNAIFFFAALSILIFSCTNYYDDFIPHNAKLKKELFEFWLQSAERKITQETKTTLTIGLKVLSAEVANNKEDKLFYAIERPAGIYALDENGDKLIVDTFPLRKEMSQSIAITLRSMEAGDKIVKVHLLGRRFENPYYVLATVSVPYAISPLGRELYVATDKTDYFLNDKGTITFNLQNKSQQEVNLKEENKIRFLRVPPFVSIRSHEEGKAYLFPTLQKPSTAEPFSAEYALEYDIKAAKGSGGVDSFVVVVENDNYPTLQQVIPISLHQRTFIKLLHYKNTALLKEKIAVSISDDVSVNSTKTWVQLEGLGDFDLYSKTGAELPINTFHEIGGRDTIYLSANKVGDKQTVKLVLKNEEGTILNRELEISVLPSEFGATLLYNYPNWPGLSTTTPETYERNAGNFDLLYTSSDPQPAVLSAKVEFGTNSANFIKIVKGGSDTIKLPDNGEYVNLPAISPNEKYTLLYYVTDLGKDNAGNHIMERENDFTIRLKNSSGVEKVITQSFMLRKSIPKVKIKGNALMTMEDVNKMIVEINDPNPTQNSLSFSWSASVDKLLKITLPKDKDDGIMEFIFEKPYNDGVHTVTVTTTRKYDGFVKDSFINVQVNKPEYAITDIEWEGLPYYILATEKYVSFKLVPSGRNTPQEYGVAFSANISTPSDFFTLSSPKTGEAIPVLSTLDVPYDGQGANPQYIWDTNVIQKVTGAEDWYRVRIDFKDIPSNNGNLTVYAKNRFGIRHQLSKELVINSIPVTFSTSLDNATPKYKANGFINDTIKVVLTNTTKPAIGDFDWSIDEDSKSIAWLVGDTLFVSSSTATDAGGVDVIVTLKHRSSGLKETKTLTFFLSN